VSKERVVWHAHARLRARQARGEVGYAGNSGARSCSLWGALEQLAAWSWSLRPTDPMGIFKNTQECKAPGAGKEHTNEVRGGGRDPGVKRPGAGLSQSPTRSKFFSLLLLLCRHTASVFFFFVCDMPPHG